MFVFRRFCVQLIVCAFVVAVVLVGAVYVSRQQQEKEIIVVVVVLASVLLHIRHIYVRPRWVFLRRVMVVVAGPLDALE